MVDRWTEENLANIIQAMVETRQYLFDLWLGNGKGLERLDKTRFSLSEMPLCPSWYAIDPPAGYTLIEQGEGEALLFPFSDHNKKKPIDTKNHQFVRNGEGYLICFTLPQFFQYQNPKTSTDGWKPGDRVNAYKTRAPDLIETYEYHGVPIARLYGRYDDIKDRLGLWYRKRV